MLRKRRRMIASLTYWNPTAHASPTGTWAKAGMAHVNQSRRSICDQRPASMMTMTQSAVTHAACRGTKRARPAPSSSPAISTRPVPTRDSSVATSHHAKD